MATASSIASLLMEMIYYTWYCKLDLRQIVIETRLSLLGMGKVIREEGNKLPRRRIGLLWPVTLKKNAWTLSTIP